MINFNKIFCLIITTLFLVTNSYAEIKDGLFATVGDKAITESDIVNEIKTILILSNRPYSEDKKEQLQSIAVKESIKRNIKKIEVEKYKNLEFNEDDLTKEIERLSSGINTDPYTLKNTFESHGINFSTIRENLKIELLWNTLIFQIYKDRLVINFEEIDEQLKMFSDKKEINEYLISEIITKKVQSSEIKSEIKNIKDRIASEGFEKVAMDESISETSMKGGDLGWVSENVITEKYKSKIINTPIGTISEAILLPEGILFFKVRDKRTLTKSLDLNDAKNQLVNAEKTKILNMYSLSHYDTLRRTIAINYY